MPEKSKRFSPRGRFDILVPFTKEEGGGYVRFTSNSDTSLSRTEIIESLQEYIDILRKVETVKQELSTHDE